MRLSAVAVSLAVLCSCETTQPTPEQIQAAQQQRVHNNSTTCERDYKAKPGTANFTQCMLALDAQQNEAAQQRLALAFAYAGNMAQQKPYQLPMPTIAPPSSPTYRPPINCNSSAYGNTVYTNCN